MDKRRCLRHEVSLPANFIIFTSQKHISIATSLNVSAKGLCLTTKEKIGKGHEMPLQIKMPSGETIRINVKVVWVQEEAVCNSIEYKVGVQIDDEMKADEKKFVKYCADLMLDDYRKREEPH